ncbi:site-specific tyrosine recombinase XerC [Roseivivax jejudonensis]|uniref:Site-specific tyrosine recombinase XerC n=1 Tax=Roseivivax jejudonensis TaxID=1529041 RepID=A0A1X7ABM9_9RHOB|nr:site-specific integrase [Roseivivax jejudonensis]SLN75011.1 site-specific tyrosine recombinase XerC [Roseivivax jejudonensis]
MTAQTPISHDRSFVPAGTPTFQDLIDKVTEQASFFPDRQRDMVSGLKRVAEVLGLPPGDVPADGRWLQPRLADIRPARIGITDKTWQNLRSNVRAAMAECGIVERRFRRLEDLDETWKALWTEVLALGDPTLPTALLRFVHFLNARGTVPDLVSEADAEAYREAVAINEISKDPETAYRAAVNGWNLARQRVPGWPDTILTLPSRQTTIRLEIETFPESFRVDLDTLLARLGKPDPLSDSGPTRALRPATLTQYRRQIVRFASELVHAGTDPGDLTSVSTLIDPEIAERGLRQMLARNDNETSRSISEMAGLLRNLAGILSAAEATRDALARLAARLALPSQRGMTAKNRARLRVLQEPRHRRRLLTLPETIFARASGKTKPHTAALAREDALAIAILLVCPLRVANLAGLEIDRHVQRPGDGRVYLVLEDEDTKTGRSIEFELPADVVDLLDRHLATRVPYMCPAGTPYLFPQRSGRRTIDPSALASRIAGRVDRETGLEVNAHLFRHFAVMNWLDANPGGYEVARRLLGHSELSHTINMYSGLEAKAATRAFSDLISDMRRA